MHWPGRQTYILKPYLFLGSYESFEKILHCPKNVMKTSYNVKKPLSLAFYLTTEVYLEPQKSMMERFEKVVNG